MPEAWFDELSELLRIPSVSADPARARDVNDAAEWLAAFVRAAGGTAEVEMRKATLKRVLGTLSARERRVLELRYGLNGEHPRTLDEVGRTFNVTRERIRQIENQSLKKLRALSDSVALRDVA